MNQEPTNAEKIRLLPWSIAFNGANAVWFYLTFFGSAFVLFLSQLGVSKTQTGSLLSLLPFFGLTALFLAPTVARWGYKRTFLVTYSGRMLITAFLLFTPWVASEFGARATTVYVTGVVIVFALTRSVSMTALLPWSQEYVPNAVRGKYSALANVFTSIAGFLAVTAGGYILGPAPALSNFVTIFAIGLGFGLLAIWFVTFIPGGAASRDASAEPASYRKLVETARDTNFLRYLLGIGFVTIVAGPLASFLPLFLEEQAGISPGTVLWLQNGVMLGGLMSGYLWGWAADRYGSKPVMLWGVGLRFLVPFFWMLLPRQSAVTLYMAFGISLLQGWADLGWSVGSGRLLYVSVVPPAKRTDYMALYYAWVGIVGGLGQLLGGRVIDWSSGLQGQFLIFTIDPYTVLFVGGIVSALAGGLLLRRIRADSAITTGEFTGMFLRGNPFTALASMVAYHRARDEEAAVAMTERLGRTGSPLTVEELLEALDDPRFNVRFEALISIARRGPDPRLLHALSQVLAGSEPALSVIAAWAMGRIGDPAAVEPLRRGLDAPYRSVRSHCARSLGTLGDRESIPVLLERLGNEADEGLRIAYAAALGKLEAQEAAGPLLRMLRGRGDGDEKTRMELALALARIVGDEYHFVHLSREVRAEPGTALSQAVRELRERLEDQQVGDSQLLGLLGMCEQAFAQEDLARGTNYLCRIVERVSVPAHLAACALTLSHCAERLQVHGAVRIEYVLLTVHALHVVSVQRQLRVFARAFTGQS